MEIAWINTRSSCGRMSKLIWSTWTLRRYSCAYLICTLAYLWWSEGSKASWWTCGSKQATARCLQTSLQTKEVRGCSCTFCFAALGPGHPAHKPRESIWRIMFAERANFKASSENHIQIILQLAVLTEMHDLCAFSHHLDRAFETFSLYRFVTLSCKRTSCLMSRRSSC